MRHLKDKVLFVTGCSRGIGRAIALRAATDGAKIAVVAKTAEPHPKLEGTVYSVAKEIKEAGGDSLPLVVDVRDEIQVEDAIQKTIDHFGSIDILINNASAIDLHGIDEMPMKKFDLLFSVNVRATYLCAKLCIPHLKSAANPHILTLSPPLSMQSKWFAPHLAYTMSKFGMSMCTVGLAEELKQYGIAANSLWPKTIIATAAIAHNFPPKYYEATRKPEFMADAAYAILKRPSKTTTGQFFIDEEVLREEGVTDFSRYAVNPNVELYPDLFV